MVWALQTACFAVAVAVVAAGGCYRKDLKPEHKPEYVLSALPHTYTFAHQLPSGFTWRNISGQDWLTPQLNQHIPVYCGACWLHGSISVLNDRLKIAQKGAGPNILLARQVVLNCGAAAGTCQGGTDVGTYKWVMEHGIPDDTCQQYDATDHECSDFRTCMNCDAPQMVKAGQEVCYPVQRYGKYFVKEWGPVEMGENISVHNMKAEIFRRGPISCNIDAGALLQGRYRRGDIVADLVRPEDGKPWETDHVISVVGWGVDAGVEYWWVRNSWGQYWGEGGFFRAAMGKNVINLESDCNWAIMDANPTTKDYGPSDADRLFPTGDGDDVPPAPPAPAGPAPATHHVDAAAVCVAMGLVVLVGGAVGLWACVRRRGRARGPLNLHGMEPQTSLVEVDVSATA